MYYHHFCNGLFQVLSKKMQVFYTRCHVQTKSDYSKVSYCLYKKIIINKSLECYTYLHEISYTYIFPEGISKSSRGNESSENNQHEGKQLK